MMCTAFLEHSATFGVCFALYSQKSLNAWVIRSYLRREVNNIIASHRKGQEAASAQPKS